MREDRIRVVSVLDPAIDRDVMTVADMNEYVRTRDFSKLRFVPGVEPQVYHIREIPHGLWERYVKSASTLSDEERWRRAFLCGVTRVENLYQRDGTTIPDWDPPKAAPGLDVMADAALERFWPAEREEIGALVLHHSFLHPRIAPSYPLPPMCLARLEELRFRRADASPSLPVQNNGKASSRAGSTQETSAQTGSESATPDVATGSPTGATAAEMPSAGG